MNTAESWSDLIPLLTEDDSVLAAVIQAVTAQSAYFRDHEDTLLERGIDEPGHVTGTIALVDALDEAGELAYLDWKTHASDVAGLLANLPRVRASEVSLEPVADLEVSLEPAVAAANRLLEPAGIAVVVLDEDSDAYPLVAVPRELLPRIQDFAARAGATVRVLETDEHTGADAAVS